ncbi:MAG: hypothetical protein AAGI89_13895 [Pseudomonadota bacterium]
MRIQTYKSFSFFLAFVIVLSCTEKEESHYSIHPDEGGCAFSINFEWIDDISYSEKVIFSSQLFDIVTSLNKRGVPTVSIIDFDNAEIFFVSMGCGQSLEIFNSEMGQVLNQSKFSTDLSYIERSLREWEQEIH